MTSSGVNSNSFDCVMASDTSQSTVASSPGPTPQKTQASMLLQSLEKAAPDARNESEKKECSEEEKVDRSPGGHQPMTSDIKTTETTIDSKSPENEEAMENDVENESDGSSVSSIDSLDTSIPKEKLRRLAHKSSQYTRFLEARVQDLERRLDIIEDIEDEGTEEVSAVVPTGVTVTPQLNHLKWHEFKQMANKPESTGKRYAIDVLSGAPVYFHQQGRKAEILKKEASNVDPMSAKIPERIRINSVSLILILTNITGHLLTDGNLPMVILRPFKPLLYHETEIRDELTRLENRWVVSTERPIDDQVMTSFLSHDDKDSPMKLDAKTDSSINET